MRLIIASFIAFGVLYSVKAAEPNIVVIFTDDQEYESLAATPATEDEDPMPKTRSLLIDGGAMLNNFFVTTPSCCVSRTTFLTGQYAHHHGTVSNTKQKGCYGTDWTGRWRGRNTKTWNAGLEQTEAMGALMNTKYNTFYMGKYLNNYPSDDNKGCCKISDDDDCTGYAAENQCECEIPEGWDDWHGATDTLYMGFTNCENGALVTYPDNEDNYLTKVMADKAETFINAQSSSKPFLMVLAPHHPHGSAEPETQYASMFTRISPPENDAWTTDPTDKNYFMSNTHYNINSTQQTDLVKRNKNKYKARYRALRSVDDMVENVVNYLNSSGFLDNTYIMYSSDNGYHYSEFGRVHGKWLNYDWDTRVPFLIRGPGITGGTEITHAVTNLDILPTMLDIGDISIPSNIDGKSILDLVKTGTASDWRDSFMLEYEGSSGDIDPTCTPPDTNFGGCVENNECVCETATYNTYDCVRGISVSSSNTITSNYLYCDFPVVPSSQTSPFVEYYNIAVDKDQTNNLASGMSAAEVAGNYSTEQARLTALSTCEGVAYCW